MVVGWVFFCFLFLFFCGVGGGVFQAPEKWICPPFEGLCPFMLVVHSLQNVQLVRQKNKTLEVGAQM